MGDDKILLDKVWKLLIEEYEATHDAKKIAKTFHVTKYTVYHLKKCNRRQGV